LVFPGKKRQLGFQNYQNQITVVVVVVVEIIVGYQDRIAIIKGHSYIIWNLVTYWWVPISV